MFFTILLVVFLYMTSWFLLATKKENMGIVDVAWGIGFILISLISYFLSKNSSLTQVLVLFMVYFWGIRLSSHIYSRNAGKPEDPRYAKWRKEWGDSVLWKSFLKVFMLQGAFMLVIALPIIELNSFTGEISSQISLLGIIGSLVWLVGISLEAVADAQLRHFISDKKNKGKLMTEGLWAYSRHPNYFGEALLWWGIWLMSFSVTGKWWTVVGPITITYLIRFVSGVTMTENRWKRKKGFAAYKKRVNAFVPWFPKNKK